MTLLTSSSSAGGHRRRHRFHSSSSYHQKTTAKKRNPLLLLSTPTPYRLSLIFIILLLILLISQISSNNSNGNSINADDPPASDPTSSKYCINDNDGVCITFEEPPKYDGAEDYLKAIEEEILKGDTWKASENNKKPCVDEDKRCSEWFEIGVCEFNPEEMFKRCRKTCNFCIDFDFDVGVEQISDGKDSERILSLTVIRRYNDYLREYVVKYPYDIKERCKNKEPLCAFWAGTGECDSHQDYMRNNCPLACRQCEFIRSGDHKDVAQFEGVDDKEISKITDAIQKSEEYLRELLKKQSSEIFDMEEVKKNCINQYTFCAFWAAMGECEKNSYFMKNNCLLACRLCESYVDMGVEQMVTGEDSESKRTLEVIRRSEEYLQNLLKQNSDENLMLRANIARKCKNNHELCSFWAGAGECSRNNGYMMTNCLLACRWCETEPESLARIIEIVSQHREEQMKQQNGDIGECEG